MSQFPEVSVINYREPGKKRGWFVGPNRGEPFDSSLCRRVTEFARTSRAATPNDLEKLR
jgi:hypothetical protein